MRSAGRLAARLHDTMGNSPLPGLERFPTLSQGGRLNTEYEERESAIRKAVQRVEDVKVFRQALRDSVPAAAPGSRITDVVVRVRLGDDRVDAVVEWHARGVGGPRVVRRIGGPLPLNVRSVRGLGAGVGLLAIMRAVEKVCE